MKRIQLHKWRDCWHQYANILHFLPFTNRSVLVQSFKEKHDGARTVVGPDSRDPQPVDLLQTREKKFRFNKK